jgi:general secretion pathway protein L
MAEYLVIRLGERVGDTAEWIAVGDDGTRRGPQTNGTLAEAALEIHDRPVIVLVPGTEVLTTFTSIPAKGARLQAVLPYALEDQLADDVDNLHFAPGKRDAGGRLPVAVVARPQMQAWLEALAAAGIRSPGSGQCPVRGNGRRTGSIDWQDCRYFASGQETQSETVQPGSPQALNAGARQA